MTPTEGQLSRWKADNQGTPLVVIDAITHGLTGAQILHYLRGWWESRGVTAVLLIVQAGTRDSIINAISVALSRHRSQHNESRNYEMRYSEGLPYAMEFAGTGASVGAELVVVARIAGGRQTQLTALFDSTEEIDIDPI